MSASIPRRQGHGVRPLKRTRIPQSTIVLTALAELSGDRTGYEERWRCAHVRYRRTGGKRKKALLWSPVGHPSQLWADVTAWCGYQGVTVLWTCDLPWLARVSALFAHLPKLGWEVDAFSLNPGSSWMVWRRGRATLKIVDVMSLWPEGLDRIATLFGRSRVDVHPDEKRHLAWGKAVRIDCEILADAVDAYTEWIKADDLGDMAVTGNGQAWRAFRRRFMTDGILIHDDPDARAAERRAMWTGRCEAYWHGPLDHAVVHEWDLTCAYTNIVAEVSVPTLLHGPADPAKPLRSYLDDDRYLLLAEVEVETSTPVVPMDRMGGIVWPVGHFVTTLWEPEVRLALDNGATVRLRRGWLYRHSHALRGWARWILTQLAADNSDVPTWRKVIVKRWGNVLIGRFAMQYPEWRRLAWNPEYDVRYTPTLDVDTGEEYAMMQVGHDVWKQVGMRDAHNSAPQVTGYAMSEARVRLWRIMSMLPPGELLYVDTDSLLVREVNMGHMVDICRTPEGRGLRLKRSWAGMEIYGPRQVVTGSQVRIAGLPRSAERVDWHDYEGEVIEGLLEAIGHGRLDAVQLTPRQWHVAGVDTRRDGPAVGWTRPFVLGTDHDAHTSSSM